MLTAPPDEPSVPTTCRLKRTSRSPREILRKLRMTTLGAPFSLLRPICKVVGNGKSSGPPSFARPSVSIARRGSGKHILTAKRSALHSHSDAPSTLPLKRVRQYTRERARWRHDETVDYFQVSLPLVKNCCLPPFVMTPFVTKRQRRLVDCGEVPFPLPTKPKPSTETGAAHTILSS